MFYFTIEEGGLYMDKQIFLDKFKELGTCEDDVQRRDILASLTDDISVLYSDIESDRSTIDVLNQTIEKNKEDIEKLRESNMNLFLRVSANKTEDQQKQDSTSIKPDEDKKLKFEDLFDEKGGLK